MTNYEYIYETMKDVKDKTPILLIGGASIIFKKLYRGNIYQVYNTEELKEFLLEFYNTIYDKPIVLEDISSISKDSILLKFVEETTIPLILLASRDNLSLPLHSRIKTIVKLPLEPSSCNFTSILEAHEYITNNDLTGDELDKYLADNCPKLALAYDSMKNRKYKDKIVQILGGLDMMNKNQI